MVEVIARAPLAGFLSRRIVFKSARAVYNAQVHPAGPPPMIKTSHSTSSAIETATAVRMVRAPEGQAEAYRASHSRLLLSFVDRPGRPHGATKAAVAYCSREALITTSQTPKQAIAAPSGMHRNKLRYYTARTFFDLVGFSFRGTVLVRVKSTSETFRVKGRDDQGQRTLAWRCAGCFASLRWWLSSRLLLRIISRTWVASRLTPRHR